MGRIAYLFPGQGSQHVGMCLAFRETSRNAAALFQRTMEALDFDLAALMADGPAAALARTENAQPAMVAASLTAWQAAREAGLPAPDFVAGHSVGEYSALVAAGVLEPEEAVRLVRCRGRFMQEAAPLGTGSMAAVLGLPLADVEAACTELRAQRPGETVVPANINSADQIVIAGHVESVRLTGERCRAHGARRVIALDVSGPFHSPLMEPAAPRLAAVLSGAPFRDATVPVVTNVDASPEGSGDRLRASLVAQVTAPVRWSDVVARLAAEGCDTFMELGPGTVLAGLVRRQLPGARVWSISHPRHLGTVRAALAA
jgi:[acyl-carrier-protein] S-malonyltransferase